jgi:CubicO group peptidase (beta-lactamase class C family)
MGWRWRAAVVVGATGIAAASVAVGCSSESERPAAAGGCDPAMDEAFEAWAAAGFDGSVAIETGGEPDCVAAYGLADLEDGTPNTTDTVFALGSVSKAFTAAAVLRLVDAGELALDDRAGDLVPGLGGPAAGATVEQLLLHTSGLTGSHGQDHQPLDHDAAVAAIGGMEQAFPPGSDFLYSNAGYTLLALIVEEAAGRPFREYMASDVLALPGGRTAGGFWDGEPAAPGPRAVGYLDGGERTTQMGDLAGPHWALSGNGDLAMTMGDLAAWTEALFAGEIVAPASVATMERPGFDQGDGVGEAPGWVALDASVYGEPLLTTAGGGGDVGHDVVVVWRPEHDQVVAIASNTADVSAEQLLDAVGPALLAGDPLPVPEVVDDVAADAAAAVAGTYRLESGGTFAVQADDDRRRLVVSAAGAGAVAALLPIAEDEVGPDDVQQHEDAVLALLDGRTRQGRAERATIEQAIGPVDARELAGTVVDGGELRTYVVITSGGDDVLVWYALDDEGGVAAAELAADPPSLVLGGAAKDADDGADDTYRPDDPTGSGPDVTVTFAGDRMTVAGPGGSSTVARRTP